MSYQHQEQVHAPYHFVPLSKWIYMPNWAHLVSHDHPFEDGVSGIIEYTLTNKTPLCVGAEQVKGSDKISEVKWARTPSNDPNKLGTPVIPGSSLKGMIRSVLEIASFGKFNAIDDQHFSFRDISSKSHYLKDIITKKGNEVQAGWIKYDEENNTWHFSESDVCKLKHESINQALKKKIYNNDTSIEKYEKVKLSTEYTANISEPKGVQMNRWADEFNKGKTVGHCVFTNKRILGKGSPSDYEFSYFFYNKKTQNKISVNSQVQHLFNNHRSITAIIDNDEIDQVEYLQKHANPEHGIPVFALKKDSEIHSLGFARMPRVSYQNGTQDLVKAHNQAHSADAYFDMAELMFGTLRDKALSLKSRITFSDASLTTSEHRSTSNSVILSSPKATFLGGYIQQNSSEKYNDYDNNKSILSGWKRYPIKDEFKENETSTIKTNKVKSKLEMLEAGSEFSGRVVFHNLKQEELSALLWCLTLGNSDFNYHSLGHGKPLGAGATQFKISDKSFYKENTKKESECIKLAEIVNDFEQHMNRVHYKENSWNESVQIQHLLALTDSTISHYNTFDYMPLKSFQQVKNNKQSLTLNDIHDQRLPIDEHSYEKSGTPSFGKGRLAGLVNNEENWDKSEIELQKKYLQTFAKKQQKEQLLKQKNSLMDSSTSPYEKCKSLLNIIADSQTSFSNTEKKNSAKELRDILKELKEINLNNQEKEDLITIYQKITVSDKETKKAIKYLESSEIK
ncbi:TIGR03986 family type III CRISPR-associated RAMP protein [Psychromonas arctica]|uniref:TIGR03986 family type III CRISPR-associated RAMP protein n=1 Tax=Psychromonas arctica TaxID=168275 RepID=UPI002FCED252